MKTLDIALIEKQLNVEGFGSPRKLDWLHDSYSYPLAFWQGLKGVHNRIFSWPSKSSPIESYDFYHDIITRNKNNTTLAFISYDCHRGWQETTYCELGLLVDKKAYYLKSLEVKAGQKICVVLPFGLEYIVSILSAFKLGLIISSLPPQGNAFVKKRLDVLSPDYVLTNHTYSLVVPDFQDKLILDNSINRNSEANSDESFSYASGSLLGLSFNPYSSSPHIPTELTSDAAYLYPLRDGLITLGVRPGDVFAAPGFHFLATQPALFLSVLLNGGTYLHLETEDIEKDPDLLFQYPIRSIGIHSKVRDILLSKPVSHKPSWKFWFRNPLESNDIAEWQCFIKDLQLEKVYVGNAVWVSAFGGCTLFSVKREGQAHFNVLPSAGVPWNLADLILKDSEGGRDYGIFSFAMTGKGEKELFSIGNILSKNRKEWVLGGSVLPGRAGRSYPVDEILDVVRGLPQRWEYSVVEASNPGSVSSSLFILLVFTCTKLDTGNAVALGGINEKILSEMGEEFLPDKIQFIPLHPKRMPDGSVDHVSCQSQYITGSLFKKSQDEMFHCLDELRNFIYQ